ncbi:MAG: alpha/beta hydrolase [Bacteroidetes bacterium]|nr:alpha/beta hydrolase [Bacteroidota bacterium]
MNTDNYDIEFSNFGNDDIIGQVEYIHEFYSYNLKNERDIIVWLPPSYSSSTKRYPVLYMHDGQNLFNPQTSFIGYDWKVDETITRLLNKNEIEEIIVVGIYNTRDRLEEYNYFTDKGKSYAQFIIQELKSHIDENYRTKHSADNTAVMGSSLGGLISFQLMWNIPAVFGKAGCLSNSFWIDNKAVFPMVKNSPKIIKKIKLYMDCGDCETELIEDNKNMYKLLTEIGYNDSLKWHIEKGGIHSEVDWAKRLHIPLKFLFGK